jgi:hypothetical protein
MSAKDSTKISYKDERWYNLVYLIVAHSVRSLFDGGVRCFQAISHPPYLLLVLTFIMHLPWPDFGALHWVELEKDNPMCAPHYSNGVEHQCFLDASWAVVMRYTDHSDSRSQEINHYACQDLPTIFPYNNITDSDVQKCKDGRSLQWVRIVTTLVMLFWSRYLHTKGFEWIPSHGAALAAADSGAADANALEFDGSVMKRIQRQIFPGLLTLLNLIVLIVHAAFTFNCPIDGVKAWEPRPWAVALVLMCTSLLVTMFLFIVHPMFRPDMTSYSVVYHHMAAF